MAASRRWPVAEDRLSFDAPIHSWDDVGKLRSSRAGSTSSRRASERVSGLLECIEQCEARGIRDVRRRAVRARPWTPPDPAACVRLLRRWAERRCAGRIQRRTGEAGPSAEPAAAAPKVSAFDRTCSTAGPARPGRHRCGRGTPPRAEALLAQTMGSPVVSEKRSRRSAPARRRACAPRACLRRSAPTRGCSYGGSPGTRA